jgi:hypothetical protein
MIDSIRAARGVSSSWPVDYLTGGLQGLGAQLLVTFLIYRMYDRMRTEGMGQAGWENCVAGRSWRGKCSFCFSLVVSRVLCTASGWRLAARVVVLFFQRQPDMLPTTESPPTPNTCVSPPNLPLWSVGALQNGSGQGREQANGWWLGPIRPTWSLFRRCAFQSAAFWEIPLGPLSRG